MQDELLRRQFLKAGVGFIAGAGSSVLFGDLTALVAQSQTPSFCPPQGCVYPPVLPAQEDWRYCKKCQELFYQGVEGSEYDKRRGVCAAGGSHEPAGYYFEPSYNIPETQTAQADWRYCQGERI